MTPLALLVSGLVAMSVVMFLIWLISCLINNAGIVDVAWAFGFFGLTLLYLGLTHRFELRQWVLLAMVSCWSLRLTWHLAVRLLKMMPAEDARYKELRQSFGNYVNAKMLLIFLWQALILTSLSAPMAVVAADHQSDLFGVHFIAISIWFVALLGESAADQQLSSFNLNPANRGRTCQVGLWKYSRHPNYFFEWLIAVAFFLYASASPYGLWTIVCPLIMFNLLINVTGVKLAEKHSLRTRADYADYQKTTAKFFPWWRS